MLRTQNPEVVANQSDTTFTGSDGQFPSMRSMAVLKDMNPTPLQASFRLSWRNVYRMPKSVNPDNFTIDVVRYTIRIRSKSTAGIGSRRSLGLTDSPAQPSSDSGRTST